MTYQERNAHSVVLRLIVLVSVCLGSTINGTGTQQDGGDFSHNTEAKKLPTGVILVKGAWSSASDSTTPVPESGKIANSVYTNSYFRFTYPLPPGWTEKFSGPPPSDSGYYVLAQIRPMDTLKTTTHGTILIAAQDNFFSLSSTENALELINYAKNNLQGDNKVERAPTPVSLANHSFIRFDYGSPVAELHWYVLATQIRCHVLQFVFTSRDARLIESLVSDMGKMTLPSEASPILGAGGEDVPACIKDYARDDNVLEKADPVFTEKRFNPVPVRIIIDKEGKVKHIHFLSAFPDQEKAISDALVHWRFRPYSINGKAAEIETGLLFGRQPTVLGPAANSTVNE